MFDLVKGRVDELPCVVRPGIDDDTINSSLIFSKQLAPLDSTGAPIIV